MSIRQLPGAGTRRTIRAERRIISSGKSTFRSRRAWSYLVRSSNGEIAEIESVIRAVTLDQSHPFRELASDLVANSWWQSRDTSSEEYLRQLLIETSATASRGALRVVTLLVTEGLPQYSLLLCGSGDNRPKSSADFFDEVRQVLAFEDEWSFELIEALGDAYTINSEWRDQIANVVWDAWVNFPKLREAIVETSRHKAVLPLSGRNRLLGSAVLGTETLLSAATAQDVPELVELVVNEYFADEKLLSSFRGLIRGADRSVLDALWLHPSVGGEKEFHQDLISNQLVPGREVIDDIWRQWDKTESKDLLAALTSWSLPYRQPAEVKLTVSQALFGESCAITRNSSDFLSGNQEADFISLCQLCLLARESLVQVVLSFVSCPDFAQLRESICQRVLRGRDPDRNLASICAKYRIAPDDEIERSVFFLITGQIDELLLADPGLEALGLGYLSAPESEREMIRKALLNQPRLNLGQVLASVNRRERLVRMSASELEYFIDQLIDRGDFESLIEIATSMSLAIFLYICVRISNKDHGWEPRNPELASLHREFRSTDLFRVLSSARGAFNQSAIVAFLSSGCVLPDESVSLSRGQDKPDGWPVGSVRARVRFDGRINDLSFSPDGDHLAIAGTNRVVGELDLTSGTLSFVERRLNSSVGSLLHLGNHRIIAAERTNRVERPCRLVLIERGKSIETLRTVTGSVTSLVRFGPTKIMFTGRDNSVGIFEVRDGVRAVSSSKIPGGYPRLAAENCPQERNIVFADEAKYVSLEHELRFGRSLTLPSRAKKATWISDLRVVQLDHGGRILTLEVDHQRKAMSLSRKVNYAFLARDLALVANRNQLAILNGSKLTIVGTPDFRKIGSLSVGGTSLHASPSGNLIAVGDEYGLLKIIDTSIGHVSALISKPLLECSPRDFQACLNAQHSTLSLKTSSAVGLDKQSALLSETLQVLISLLRYRFRYDISIVETRQIKAGDYDITLA